MQSGLATRIDPTDVGSSVLTTRGSWLAGTWQTEERVVRRRGELLQEDEKRGKAECRSPLDILPFPTIGGETQRSGPGSFKKSDQIVASTIHPYCLAFAYKLQAGNHRVCLLFRIFLSSGCDPKAVAINVRK